MGGNGLSPDDRVDDAAIHPQCSAGNCWRLGAGDVEDEARYLFRLDQPVNRGGRPLREDELGLGFRYRFAAPPRHLLEKLSHAFAARGARQYLVDGDPAVCQAVSQAARSELRRFGAE
jgi:hypothetical protein